jgi:hypothetical protein
MSIVYGQQDSFFAAMQARMADEEKGQNRSASDSNEGSSFKSNKLRGVIFDRVAGVMQPDRKHIDRYKELLKSSYIASAKAELNTSRRKTITRTNRPTYQGVGWAEGNRKGGLYREFGADVYLNILKGKKGTIEINYEIVPDFSKAPWGKDLAEDRHPKKVSLKSIYKWVNRKISNGHFRITKNEIGKIKNAKGATSSSISKKKSSLITGVSIAIMKSIEKNPKPPVIKDWYLIDKNKRLNLSFRKAVDKKGSYYRTQIRKNIIKKINALN